jgi:foldase protein PrsA
MKKYFALIILALTLIALLGACSENKEEAEEAKDTNKIEFPEFDKAKLTGIDNVAEYEGGTVTGEEFAQYLAIEGFMNPKAPLDDQSYQNEGVQFLVMEEAISAKVEDKSWAEEQADALWEQVTLTYDEETRERGYEELGITEEEIKDYIVNFYLVQDYFRNDITDKEIEDYYKNLETNLTNATFRHILISTKETNEAGETVEKRTDEEALTIIEEIQAKLEDGESFTDLADEYNEDPGSAETSGLYENAPVASLDENFKNAVLSQDLEVVGEPVQTAFGYHLIQVDKREVTPLEDVREAIVQQIAFEKSNNYLVEEVPGLITKLDESVEKVETEETEEG